MTAPERVEAAARAQCAADGNDYDALVAQYGVIRVGHWDNGYLAVAGEVLAASDAIFREGVERALYEIEGVHHFHGNKCLCGFESARSRSRTEHITGEVRTAFLALLGVEG